MNQQTKKRYIKPSVRAIGTVGDVTATGAAPNSDVSPFSSNTAFAPS